MSLEGTRRGVSGISRQDTTRASSKPGLRAMLYGLTLKMEREEAKDLKNRKKMQGTYVFVCALKSLITIITI
jgi:hypothetical protein